MNNARHKKCDGAVSLYLTKNQAMKAVVIRDVTAHRVSLETRNT
jgi:hypothetical protein